MSTDSTSSTPALASASNDSPPYPYVRDPAPHRGFNPKAREVLLDNHFHGSDGQLLIRKMSGLKLNTNSILPRTDSDDQTISGGGSQKSYQSTQSCAGAGDDSTVFDEIGERPNIKHKAHKLLGEIGKTRSFDADLLMKRQTGKGKKVPLLQKTLQEMNIIKMPSFDDNDDDERVDNHSHKSASSLLESG